MPRAEHPNCEWPRDGVEKSKTYLVAKTLRSNDGYLIADSFIGFEIEGELGVVSLDDDLSGFLDSLGTNTTHDCGVVRLLRIDLMFVQKSGVLRFVGALA